MSQPQVTPEIVMTVGVIACAHTLLLLPYTLLVYGM
jgi:hypothetical protein